ncbi:hypothetical protein VTI28DRAFT_8705 [Corynascus sepedonium]
MKVASCVISHPLLVLKCAVPQPSKTSREGCSAVQRGRRLAVAIWLVIRYLETIRDPAVLFISHGGGSRWKDKVVARSKARS